MAKILLIYNNLENHKFNNDKKIINNLAYTEDKIIQKILLKFEINDDSITINKIYNYSLIHLIYMWIRIN